MLQEYLNEHILVSIGHCDARDETVFCSEVIVDCWEDLIELVYAQGYFISEISWWQYCSISAENILGGGGPIDKRDPNYFWSELYMPEFDCNLSGRETMEEIKRYIKQKIESYLPQYMIVPAFTIAMDCSSVN